MKRNRRRRRTERSRLRNSAMKYFTALIAAIAPETTTSDVEPKARTGRSIAKPGFRSARLADRRRDQAGPGAEDTADSG